MEREAEAKLPDPMRIKYRPLSPEDKALMDILKVEFHDLWMRIDELGQSRELSIAKTKLEEACMWAVKHITA